MKNILAGMTGLEVRTNLNSRDKQYDIRDGGAYVDDSHDDTAAVQATINECLSNGGGTVIIPDTGHAAIIDGALQTNVGGINYKSQLYIPQKNFNDTSRTTITIRGETMPNLLQTAAIGSGFAPVTGSRLRSTLISSTDESYVIASKGAATNYLEFNYNQTNVKDLGILVAVDPSNKLTLGGLGFKNSANNLIENVAVFPFNLHLSSTAEPTVKCIGIAMTDYNGEAFSYINNCVVGGFYHGFFLGDHFVTGKIAAWACLNAFTFGHFNQLGSGNYMEALYCKNTATFVDGISRLCLKGLHTEWGSSGKWFDSVKIINDASNYGQGIINYDIAYGNELRNDFFSKTGGANLRCCPIDFVLASEFTVTGARDEPEGALKDLIAKLVAQGIIVDGTTAS